MASDDSADVVVVGTGVVGCLIAEQALDAGLSVLMLEAGPRVERWRIVENYRNLPPSIRLFHWDAPYPPKPWAPHLETRGDKEAEQYLQLEGPNARAYLQGYVRYAGGATWHWAGICWRLTPEDMRLKSLYGVGRDWPFGHDVIEPYYTRAEYAIGVCGPSDPALQWPPNTKRSKPYPMGPTPFGPGEHRLTEVAAKIGMINLPAPQARNSGVSYHGRPPCCGNNNCFPVCPIAAKYDAATALPKIEAKGGKILANAVVYRIETGEKNAVEAVHYFDPDKASHRVTGKTLRDRLQRHRDAEAAAAVERRSQSQRRREQFRSGRAQHDGSAEAHRRSRAGGAAMDRRRAGSEQQHSEYDAGRIPQPPCRRAVPHGELRPQPARRRRRAEKGAGRQGPGCRRSGGFPPAPHG